MLNRTVPIPGVPPHEWHKHPPNIDEDEARRETRPSRVRTISTGNESIGSLDSISVKAETTSSRPVIQPAVPKIPLKQWNTTANDPMRNHRLMKPGFAAPFRAAPSARTLEQSGFNPQILYPLAHDQTTNQGPQPDTPAQEHRPVRVEPPQFKGSLVARPEAPSALQVMQWNGDMMNTPPGFRWKSARPRPDDAKVLAEAWRQYYDSQGPTIGSRDVEAQSQDSKAQTQDGRFQPEQARVQQQQTDVQQRQAHVQPQAASVCSQQTSSYHESLSAWRDFAANPEPEKIGLPVRDFSGSTEDQRQESFYDGKKVSHGQPEKGSASEKIDKPARPEKNRAPAPITQGSGSHVNSNSAPTTEDDQYSFHTIKTDSDSTFKSMRRQYGPKHEPQGNQRLGENNDQDVSSGKGTEPMAPAEMRSPDLRQIHIPRPNHNYTRSERSMVSVLSLNEDDNARGDAGSHMTPGKYSDIRSKIGFPADLHVSPDGKLVDTDVWAGGRQPNSEKFLDPVYHNPWIKDYVKNQVDCDVRADFIYKVDPVVHCHSDVDTFSGELLSPVKHEYTVPDYVNTDNVEHQMTRSSSLFLQKMAANKNRDGGNRSNNGRGRNNNHGRNNSRARPFRPDPNFTETPPPMSMVPQDSAPQKQGFAQEHKETEDPSDDEDPFAPRVPCHMRPAHKDDMDGVSQIYNWEVEKGLQALDTKPLTRADWEGILKKTQDAMLPFVVVIRGAYEHKGKSRFDNPSDYPEDEVAGKVIAFGFLSIRQPGLAGSFEGTSRMSAKAMVFVHPGYRHKKLFHICIDKLLSTVSIRYSTKRGYDFINPGDNPTYKYPWQHDRKMYSVIVEYLVPRLPESGGNRFLPDETDLTWFERIMTSNYGFWKVGRLNAAHRSRLSYEPRPIWLDTVMFEHTCQQTMGFTDFL
ncbi:hypothetical protein GE09DRAFT_1158966 [Coniochaeta sp. 2T2.1]|nr:hypothetical protein GE09DRAFT_1158966 [Coniochaeta sp. 2T2.1]